MKNGAYNVQDTCQHFGIGREALLRWEQEGLLKPDWFTPSGHRRYDPVRLARLTTVVGAKNAKRPRSKGWVTRDARKAEPRT